jgi:hypothetical protein
MFKKIVSELREIPAKIAEGVTREDIIRRIISAKRKALKEKPSGRANENIT